MMITAKKYAYLVDEYKAKLRMLWTILAGQQLDNKMILLTFDNFYVKEKRLSLDVYSL